MIEKIIDLFKRLIKIILDILMPKVNYITADDNIVVTADYKIFNTKGDL